MFYICSISVRLRFQRAPSGQSPLSTLAAPLQSAAGAETFREAFRDAACRPVTEIVPRSALDGPAAFGFALAWLVAAANGANGEDSVGPRGVIGLDPLYILAAPDMVTMELGPAYAPGLRQFGLPADRLLYLQTRVLQDALWSTEQALRLPQARVLCMVPHNSALTLPMTRRLHLAAEKSAARCLLLRFDPPTPTAAWTRWQIAAAPSDGEEEELGRPCFTASLTRRRGGAVGQNWLVEWNAYECAFADARARDLRLPLAGAVAAATADRSSQPSAKRAA